MTRLAVAITALLMTTCVLSATEPDTCGLTDAEVGTNFLLPRATKAIAETHRLDVLVMGAGSSILPGPKGTEMAYPARLQAALAAKLPGIAVTVSTNVGSRRTAGDMVRLLPASLEAKPALMIWQTGTVDAMFGVDPDLFGDTLDRGIRLAHDAGTDVVLLNMQYSPRTESMIALGNYAEAMRWVALQREVPLFDRFGVMRQWSELGTFDLRSATNKLDTARRVHDCIGRLLADFLLESIPQRGK